MHFLWPMSVECMVSCGTGQPQYSQIMAIHMYCWPEPYIYGAYTVFLAGKSPNIRSYTVCMYGSGQPYTYGYGQYPRSIHSYGYGQYPRSIHSWLWPIPKVNTFMAMANTQGQYIHMVMAITQGQYIHMAMANIWPLHSYGYGQYLRSIHSCLWPIPKVNTFIWLWPVPKVNTFMTMANTQGQYIHMVMANTQG